MTEEALLEMAKTIDCCIKLAAQGALRKMIVGSYCCEIVTKW
jgi:hypothetical protein